MIARLDHSNGALVPWSSLSSLGYLLSIILGIVFSPQLLLIFRRWGKQNNSKDLTDTAFVINRMSTAVIFLKERRYHDNYFLVVGDWLTGIFYNPTKKHKTKSSDKSTVTSCKTGMLYIFSQPSFLVCWMKKLRLGAAGLGSALFSVYFGTFQLLVQSWQGEACWMY